MGFDPWSRTFAAGAVESWDPAGRSRCPAERIMIISTPACPHSPAAPAINYDAATTQDTGVAIRRLVAAVKLLRSRPRWLVSGSHPANPRIAGPSDRAGAILGSTMPTSRILVLASFRRVWHVAGRAMGLTMRQISAAASLMPHRGRVTSG
jgi:hypothetical protein